MDSSIKTNICKIMRESKIEPWSNNPSSLVDELERFAGSDLADSKFVTELENANLSTVFQCIAEAEVARLLKKSHWNLKSKDSGPDFIAEKCGRQAYFEVISPRPIDVPEEMLAPNWNTSVVDGISVSTSVGNLDYQSVELRLTSAVKEKANKFKKWIKVGKIDPEKECVIVVSMMQLGMQCNQTVHGYPSIVSSLYPLGPTSLTVNVDTGEFSNSIRTTRESIKNKNDSQIPTNLFLTSEYSHIDRVIGIWYPVGTEVKQIGAEVLNISASKNINRESLLGLPSYVGENSTDNFKIHTIKE